MTNPLLHEMLTRGELPRYDLIRPEHVAPAVDQLLADARKTLADVTDPTTPLGWESVMEPLTDATERLGRAWGAVHHMSGVMDSPEWREAINSRLAEVTAFGSELAQHPELFRATKALDAEFKKTPAALRDDRFRARLRALENSLRSFRLGGAELADEQKKQFADLQSRLAQLNQKFSEQLLDSTNATIVHVTDAKRLEGLPEHAVASAAEEAKKRACEGWVFTLQHPSVGPVLQFAKDRSLREEIYRRHAVRASDIATEGPDHDNGPVMGEILSLRQQQASLLGYKNAAEVSLAPKMADSPQQVIDFLMNLASKARPAALDDLAELKRFAATELAIPDLQAWDVAYASEQLRQQRYAFSEEEVRQYFPLPKVLDGLFRVIRTLFNVTVRPVSNMAPLPVWHSDVQLHEIIRDGEIIGHLYLDLYARSTKRGGAWMDDSRGRRILKTQVQRPIALLTCNFSPPVGDKPTTLTHDDVITLFHEFGHGLHHLLTQVGELEVSGINGVEWDAVELPSQFMENFCWEWETLSHMTAHITSGTPIPRDLFDKMIAAKNFQSGMFMLRQVEFSVFDMRIHMDLIPPAAHPPAEVGQSIQDVLWKIRDEIAVLIPPSFNRFAQSFSHIFAGGYAAGYYSYKWAEVLSADAYAAFEEAGAQRYPEVGQRFWREILSVGGSRPAMASFTAFRGREPIVEPLLRHNGLLKAA
ncbi:MAG: M3 family metallopeptidase [Burkholderiaceae bacterium]|nr:M3 family metallopeptidase [Burkholderiaceae bacterium]